MPLEEPAWWYETTPRLPARLLTPIAHVWGRIAEYRLAKAPAYRARVPVFCVGNFTAGGTGKTPFALMLAELLRARGADPVFLTRGYGGRRKGPHWVDVATNNAQDVGDEPLLLARSAPVMLARNRANGARAIEKMSRSNTAIIMDDGLQNPSLAKDLTIAIVDGRRGVGNGCVIPAGPLRAPLDSQLKLADIVILNTPRGATSDPNLLPHLLRHFARPIFQAITDAAGPTEWLRERPILGFAGIGAPERFFEMLRSLGAEVAETRAFADHHEISPEDARDLLRRADDNGWQLVTTEKDQARMTRATGDVAQLRERSRILPITCRLPDIDQRRLETAIDRILSQRSATTKR